MRIRLLVTGFGPFPGAAANPTQAALRLLARDHARAFARRGVELRTEVLPVVYEGAQARVAALVADFAPHAILHLGLAARRPRLTLETRARNRLSLLHPDAQGRRAATRLLEPGGPAARPARAPLAPMLAGLRRAGFPCALSNDAGDYLCNQTFHASLGEPAPAVAFLHLPRPRRADRPKRRRRTARRAVLLAGQARSAAITALVLSRYICGHDSVKSR